VNPFVQVLRPISPIFLIFLSSVFPTVLQTAAGVHTIERQYLRAADNFGISRQRLFFQVVIPAALPQIIVGMRVSLGIAWLVVVAAEMIALHSGLGYLIIDSRNAGNRYDLVVAGKLTDAAALWQRMLPAQIFFWTHDYNPSVKLATNLRGGRVGACRMPLQPLGEDDQRELKRALAALGTPVASAA